MWRFALVFAGAFLALPASAQQPKFFVIHCTGISSSSNQDEAFFESYFNRKKRERATNRGHGLITPNGRYLTWWPLSKRDVHGTKTETCSTTRRATYGTFINIEVAYDCGNLVSPAAPTQAQYQKIADVYAEAHAAFGPLTIVSHKEVDRGLDRGHKDPYNFSFASLYKEIENKKLDMTKIKRISDERHAKPSEAGYSHVAPPNLDAELVSERQRPDDCKDYPTRPHQ